MPNFIKNNFYTILISAIPGVILLLIKVFQRPTAPAPVVFVPELDLDLIFTMLFIAGILLSIIFLFIYIVVFLAFYFLKKRKIKIIKGFIPICVNLIFIPLTLLNSRTVTIEEDFKYNLKDREKIVEMVKSKELVPYQEFACQGGGGPIKLPFLYRDLSKSGEIIFSQCRGETKIEFYTFRGVIDNFAVFMYMEEPYDLESMFEVREVTDDNQTIYHIPDLGCTTVIGHIQFNENWSWLSCT